jgi:antitoxin HicB
MTKDAAYYLSLPYTIEDGVAYWFARVRELPGCMTEAERFEQLDGMIQEAMTSWLEDALADGDPIPEPRPVEEYSGKFVIRLPRSLHRDLVETAVQEGVSLNAFITAALARAVGQATKQPEINAAYSYQMVRERP